MERPQEISPSASTKKYEGEKKSEVSRKYAVEKRIEVKKDSNKKESKVNRKTSMDAVMGRIDGQEELQVVADDLTTIGEALSKQLNCKYNTYTSSKGELVLEFIDSKNKLIRSVKYNTDTNVFVSDDLAFDNVAMQPHEHQMDMKLSKVGKNGIQLSFDDGGNGGRMDAVYDEKTRKVTVSREDATGKMKILFKDYSFKGKSSKQISNFILKKFTN